MRLVYVFFLFLIIGSCSQLSGDYSTFNFKRPDISTKDNYSFIVGGHLYGKQNSSIYPSNTLTSNISAVDGSDARFFVGLGDIVREPDSVQLSFFKTLFTDNLRIPFYNAVGNHDVLNRELYEAVYGRTYFDFEYRNDLFVFLDTELDSGRISGKQSLFFRKVLNNYVRSEKKGHIFIFMHKLIWNGKPELQILYEHTNQIYNFMDPEYYYKEWEPLLTEIAKNNETILFSGDLGANNTFPLFYHYDDKSRITYVAAGIGDIDTDALVKVVVANDRSSEFELISLGEKRHKKLVDYNIDFWKRHYATSKMSSEYFWLIFCVCGLIICTLVLKYKLKKHE